MDVPTKLDTDKGIVTYSRYILRDNILEPCWKLLGVLYFLNILIATVGMYSLNLIITKYESYQHTNSTRKVFNSIYWASVSIAGVINIVGLGINILWFRYSTLEEKPNLLNFRIERNFLYTFIHLSWSFSGKAYTFAGNMKFLRTGAGLIDLCSIAGNLTICPMSYS